MSITANFALPLAANRETAAPFRWLARIQYLLRRRARLARRRHYRDIARNRAHDWILALSQSRHG